MRRYLVIRDPQGIIDDLKRMAPRLGSPERAVRDPDSRLRVESIASHLDSSANGRCADVLDDSPDKRAWNQPRPSATVDDLPLIKVNEASKQAEAEIIVRTLNSTFWNRKRAAAILGVDYKALLYKMKKLGIASSTVMTVVA